MKKLLIAAFCFSFLVGASCNKSKIEKSAPECIKKEIRNNENDPNWMYRSVDEYEFQGRIVYTFSPDTKVIADGSTDIKDGNCTLLCTIGGFGGPSVSQCNGLDFYTNATLRRNIWKK